MSDPIEEMAEDAVREIWRGPRTATRIKAIIDSRYRDLAAKEAMCRDDRVAEREKQVRELEERIVSDRALLIAERDAALDSVRGLVLAARDCLNVLAGVPEKERLRAILEQFKDVK